ncbi:MAG: disulfide bond formation protein B [Acidimicrobiales bacterium]
MSVDQFSLFFALLAVVAQLGAVGLAGAGLVPRARAAVRNVIGPSALWLAAGVAAVCMGGSLYFSERAGFPPCALCWYQRICMYPLVAVVGLAAARRDFAARLYAAPLVLIGFGIATYHVLLERFPSLETGVCEVANPCSIVWVERLGYVTIPVMSLSGFALIGTLLAYASPEAP